MSPISKIIGRASELSDTGQGLVRIGKELYAVSNLLPKEEALLEINSDFQYQKARVLKILKPSPIRQDPGCEVFQKCGGCQLLHMDYKSQIEFKRDYVLNAFKEEKLSLKIDDVITAASPFHYRNKMQVAFRYKEGKLVYGFFEEESHRVTPIISCPVQTKAQNEIVKDIQNLMVAMKIPAYNEDKRTGLVRFALIKEAFNTGEIMVVIVTQGENFPGRNDFQRRLREKHPEITTIVQNINTRQTSIILGDQERVIFGPGFIVEELLGMKFKISSKTFFQINPEQTAKLYQKILDYGEFTKDETVIDAYCGMGTIGMVVSPYVKQVIGVESNKQSVINGVENLRLNHLNNLQLINDDATLFLEKTAKTDRPVDAIILDPPRSGSTEKFLKAILAIKPKKVIYVSCEAKTLARDLRFLQNDYVMKKVAIVDMFVGTYHVETVCQLVLKEKTK